MRLGIDLGSRCVKLAWESGSGELELRLYDTVDFYAQVCLKVREQWVLNWESLGLPRDTEVKITGYGRNVLGFTTGKIISELKAHTLGALKQTGLQDFVLLDIGGQDSKVIRVDSGRMADFKTNDRCAACTGRYLENMAQVLKLSLEQLGRYWKDPEELSSTCAVFGESELIAHLAQGERPAKLAAGVNYSIYKRFKPLLAGYSFAKLVLVGGVAQNQALRQILQHELQVTVVVPEHPQHNAAIGCLQ